jgi:N-acetylglucosamine PTS system EIICBA or EIICB component
VNEPALKQLGARGVIRPSPGSLQVVLGPMADQVAGEIRAALREMAAESTTAAGHDPQLLLKLLGGRENVLDLAAVPGRLLLKLARPDVVDDRALEQIGVRGVARAGTASLQVLVSGPVESTAAPLRALLASP